jgi:hypothetical protein
MWSSDEESEAWSRKLLRRGAGWIWILVWGVVLWNVAAPWRDLGGLVDERLRWLERFVLGAGSVVGWQVGAWGRRAARPGAGRSHAGLLRWLLWPLAGLGAAGMAALHFAGNPDPIGVVLTALLSYWAGLDLAFGAWPLVRGQPYSFTGWIDQPVEAGPDEEEPTDPPPWMGL